MSSTAEAPRSISDAIVRRLAEEESALRDYWTNSEPVRHCFVDNLFPEGIANLLYDRFPDPQSLQSWSTLRERKRTGNSLGEYDPIVGEALLAFQDPRVLEVVSGITGIPGLLADDRFYASGVSHMQKGDFLNPHLDNSHDGDGKLYRVLNLLYYAAPAWKLENGGNLELWEKGLRNGHTVVSEFNRLVIMETNRQSWHSVSEVVAPGSRICYSNYFFTAVPPETRPFMHVTTFAGRPDERVKGMILRVDGITRNAVKRLFPRAGLLPPKEANDER